jgi:hypothetical protein
MVFEKERTASEAAVIGQLFFLLDLCQVCSHFGISLLLRLNLVLVV